MKPPKKMKLNQIEKAVLEAVSRATLIDDILMPTRKREYADARSIAYIIFRDLYFMTYHRIGAIFDKDHATIMHGYKGAKTLMEYDKNFSKNYYCAMALVGGRGERMSHIVSQIKSLEEELLTLQKLDYELQI
jgi:chromosomal replication initiation ATPase DnaA